MLYYTFALTQHCTVVCVRHAQLERRCERLLVEKENLRTELEELRAKQAAAHVRSTSGSGSDVDEAAAAGGQWRLDERQGQKRGSQSSQQPIDPDSGAPYPVLARYDPESPQALKRKVRELEAQVHDLIEANESTALVLQTTERELEHVKGLGVGVGYMSAAGSDPPNEKIISDLRGENRRLRESVDKLRRELLLAEVNAKHPGAAQPLAQTPAAASSAEFAALRDENAALREQLTRSRHERERGGAALNRGVGSSGGQSRFGSRSVYCTVLYCTEQYSTV